MSSSFSSYVKGVLVGLGVGFLVAPKSGKETREDIGAKFNDLKKQSKDLVNIAIEKGEEVTDTPRDAADDVRKSLVDSSRKLRSTLSDTAKTSANNRNFCADVR